MTSILYLIIAICCSASMAIILKIFREQHGNRYAILLGNYITCVILSFVMMPDRSSLARISGTTWICGLIAGILFVAGLVSMQGSIRKNGAILSSAFSKLGLIVPLLLSVLLFGEKIRVLQIVGIVVVLIAFCLISFDSKRKAEDPQRVYPLLLILVLICNGFADSMAKIFEQVGTRNQDGSYFLILFSTAAILAFILLLIEKKKTGHRVIWKEFAAGVLVGIPNYFSSSLLLKALKGLPAFLVYPCFSAGTIIIVTIFGLLLFKERPGIKAWIGLGMIAAALIVLNI